MLFPNINSTFDRRLSQNHLLMFAHDSQVFCGQRLGRGFGSCSSLFSHPWTEPEVRQRVCEGKVGEKHKKKSKLLVEFLKPTRINQRGTHQEKLYKRKYLLYFLYLSGNFNAGCKSLQGQAGCLQTKPVHKPQAFICT